MSRFEQIFDPTGNPALETLYADMLAKGFGQDKPTNWLTSQSTRPDLLAASWDSIGTFLLKGQLPATVKQMIVTAISVQNDCRYCSIVHSNALKRLGVPQNVVEACVSDPQFRDMQEPHRSILRFASNAARDPKSVTPDDYETFRDNGLTDEEILEIISLVAFTNFINTWADISGVEP